MESGDYSFSFPNQYIVKEILPNTKCLDVGCWTGNLGKFLIENKNCVVDGIDFKSEVLEVAQSNGYNKTFLMNLNSEFLDLKIIKKKYQVIILADVLEHLTNPRGVLSYLKQFLSPGGQIIISLPNVAFILNRIFLLSGKWNYKEFGTLDKTHLRFFTIKSGVEMIKSAGFDIVKIEPYNQFGVLRYIKPLTRIFPSLFAYQFLIVARPG